MKPYPLFFDLRGRRCLVAGGGRVGTRKASGLLEAGAVVVVVDPSPTEELLRLAASGPELELRSRPFEDADCGGCALVFACTDRPDVNAAVAEAAAAAGAPCCRADGGGQVFGGALLRSGDVSVAVSTGGRWPRLAASVRDSIRERFPDGFEPVAQRARVAADAGQGAEEPSPTQERPCTR